MGPERVTPRAAPPGALVFVVALVFLALFRRQALLYPPYWDAILGPFTEAIWLAQSGFDYAGLARDALGYFGGGPRSYFFSFHPALLAALMRLVEDRELFLLLGHGLAIALAAASAAILYALARGTLGARTALLAAALLLLHPLFLAQAYALGMEIWVLCAGLAGALYYARGRTGVAGALLLACFYAKANGVVVALAVAAAFAATRLRRPRDLATLAWLGLPGLLYPLQSLLAAHLFRGHEPDLTLRSALGEDAFVRFLDEDPVLFLAIVAVPLGLAAAALVAGIRSRAALRQRLERESVLLVAALVCAQLYLASELVSIFLSRYFLVGLPFALLGLLWLAQRIAPRLPAAVAAALLVWQVTQLFAEPAGVEAARNNGHHLERTLAYEDDIELDLELVRRLEARYRDAVIVTSRPFVQMLSHPWFFYLEQPLRVVSTDVPSLHWLGVPSLRELDLGDDELTARMLWVWAPSDLARENRPNTQRDVLVERLERGNRRVYLYRRHPAYYRAVSRPGFRGWSGAGYGLDRASLEAWAAGARGSGG